MEEAYVLDIEDFLMAIDRIVYKQIDYAETIYVKGFRNEVGYVALDRKTFLPFKITDLDNIDTTLCTADGNLLAATETLRKHPNKYSLTPIYSIYGVELLEPLLNILQFGINPHGRYYHTNCLLDSSDVKDIIPGYVKTLDTVDELIYEQYKNILNVENRHLITNILKNNIIPELEAIIHKDPSYHYSITINNLLIMVKKHEDVRIIRFNEAQDKKEMEKLCTH